MVQRQQDQIPGHILQDVERHSGPWIFAKMFVVHFTCTNFTCDITAIFVPQLFIFLI